MLKLKTIISCIGLSAAIIAMPAAAEKTYTVATDATFAPFESLSKNREIVGFDADIIKAIAAKQGFKVKMNNTPWEGLFVSLNNGERDIVIAAVTITPERQKSMDFSAPYFDAKQLIVVKENSPIKQFSDLKGKKVGVQNGTTGDTVVQKQFGKTNPDIRRYENITLALSELSNSGVSAVVADNAVVRNYLVNNPKQKFRLIDDTSFEVEHYGIAVRKGNTQLLNEINAGLAGIKADGSYQKIQNKYFGK
ncbi:basic amino acid ABC transporter substrate-binding protein [uncultured Deefgea sp.]|uniref:basic amino acid ABC transporter substrate-binding protein n=1 Tax=uncultured Deefgea sp. TaxID=1304914 RepID=UPI002594E4DD|nr:basic amino acid ABC transporter substrate-binding protein [uncultured Deefgea sp.]